MLTAPSCHPVQLQLITKLFPQLPDSEREPEPRVTVCEMERELHEQEEKGAIASLSFTTKRVRGRAYHGRPCNRPSLMPETIFSRVRRASNKPGPRIDMEWENNSLLIESIEKIMKRP